MTAYNVIYEYFINRNNRSEFSEMIRVSVPGFTHFSKKSLNNHFEILLVAHVNLKTTYIAVKNK